MSLKEKYAALSPSTKKNINIGLLITVFILMLVMMYYASGATRKRPIAQSKQTVTAKDFNSDDDRNTSLQLALDKKLKAVMNRIEALENKPIPEPVTQTPMQPYSVPEINEAAPPEKIIAPNSFNNGNKAPNYSYPPASGESPSFETKGENKPVEKIISGIDYVSIPIAKPEAEKKSSNGKINYVPSNSIFKAVLLTGVYAKTSSQGKANPTPVVFRLTDLSFFPNEVRRNLAGCYIGGEAHGELSDERVHTRLTSLSCITSDRQKVVDISVTGRVQGGDGSVGIAGKVISKQEAALLLAGASGFIEGGAEGFSAANSTQNVNVFGTSQQTYTDDQIARNALGKGLGKSAGVLTDFFEDLLQEIKPVILAQGGQEVEIIITKGFSLELEDWKWSGIKY